MWPADQAWRAPVGDFPPRWASAWGDDRYGLWADLVVGGVTQRMRWIEPTGPEGFWMGSTGKQLRELRANSPSDSETGVWRGLGGAEAPRHCVVLGQGFWLADTPCTQALWLEVTNGNQPSLFANRVDSQMRPVEQVSWQDVNHVFLVGLRSHGLPVSLLQTGLPTEAEWEYACRAGSVTAYAWGDTCSSDQANVIHAAGALRETSPVKRYKPNAWGLYDMHGNVWEWCADGWREYSAAVATDPVGLSGPQDPRVVRGGSWLNHAAEARSACRHPLPPGLRHRSTGFRLALRSPALLQPSREPA